MMQSRKSRRSNGSRGAERRTVASTVPVTDQVLREQLKELIEQGRTQSIRFEPEQKDVPRLRFSQNTLFNIELSYIATISTSTTVQTTGALVFQLSNSPQAQSYTTIFDRYRMIQANVKFIQYIASANAAPIYTVLDYDDGNAPSSVAALLAYGSLKITPAGQIDERTLTPRIATAAYSGTFTSYANVSSRTWIDSASPSVDYFGVKYAVPLTATSYSISAIVTMMLQFKSQRAT